MSSPDRRSRLAVFSPWPPQASGVADYAARLVSELHSYYRVDRFHGAGFPPEFSANFSTIDARIFPRLSALRRYRGVIYQMGNSRYHAFLYPHLLRFPGIVALHDLRLTAFHHHLTVLEGGLGHLSREIAHDRPAIAATILPKLRDFDREPGGLPVALGRRGLDLNRRVFERARAVVVHSEWCRGQIETRMPEHAAKVAVIPLGATTRIVDPREKKAIRARFSLPESATLVGSLGLLSWGKLNEEALAAFAKIAADAPDALFVFGGADLENGRAAREAERLGISHRTRFLGRCSEGDFRDLAAILDVGVNLRRPPTDGETSASLLDLMAAGVPTLVTDVATFADYPDSTVAKIAWDDARGPENLAWILRKLVLNPRDREATGTAARAYVRDHHGWNRVADLYHDLIERTADPVPRPSVSGACPR